MATLAEQILELIETRPGLTDREITNALRGLNEPQQPINSTARALQGRGLLERRRRDDGLLGNYVADADALKRLAKTAENTSNAPKNHDVDALSEDEIKKVLVGWLEAEGWNTEVAWGRTPGIDIEARRGHERWIIEVKGPGSRPPMRVNYFLGILGETLQRMDDDTANYSIALPDLPQFRGLWERLPQLAKRRTGISVMFVDTEGRVRLES